MRLILPPKRWEADGPQFDSLRFLPWYSRGLRRKHLIPALEQANRLVQQGQPQWKAAAEFKVDERELRDYSKFVSGQPLDRLPIHARIIDLAYSIYCDSGLKHSFSFCMEKAGDYYGQNPRACRELWEVDPCYYPSLYIKPS